MLQLPQKNSTLRFGAKPFEIERAFMLGATPAARACVPRGAACGCVVFAVGEARCPAHGVWS